jgi:hypothetical protein
VLEGGGGCGGVTVNLLICGGIPGVAYFTLHTWIVPLFSLILSGLSIQSPSGFPWRLGTSIWTQIEQKIVLQFWILKIIRITIRHKFGLESDSDPPHHMNITWCLCFCFVYSLSPDDKAALVLHRQGFNSCYRPIGLTCSTSGGKVSLLHTVADLKWFFLHVILALESFWIRILFLKLGEVKRLQITSVHSRAQ